MSLVTCGTKAMVVSWHLCLLTEEEIQKQTSTLVLLSDATSTKTEMLCTFTITRHFLEEKTRKRKWISCIVPWIMSAFVKSKKESSLIKLNIYVTNTFFKGFPTVRYTPSIRPGKAPGEPIETDVCSYMYLPSAEILKNQQY